PLIMAVKRLNGRVTDGRCRVAPPARPSPRPSESKRRAVALPKLGMEPIRRRQLIDATVAAIHEHGFADTTVSRISALAGVSSGIVHHYFGGKDDLLEATLRAIAAELRRDTTDRLARACNPRERIDAVIDSNLDPERFTPTAVS